MPSHSDATPAYRGYRLQTLYTLNRIIARQDGDELIFQPEGKEDLAVYNAEGKLLEIIQVKERSSNLNLSSFEPGKSDSFFYRVAKEIAAVPYIEITIVAFGSVGRELRQAIQTEGNDRSNAAKKLADYKFVSEAQVKSLFDKISLENAGEKELTEKIYKILSESLPGIDPANAFDLLMFWLYVCAERKTEITRRTLLEKINEVGQFVASRAAHHREWFTSIVPIEDSSIDETVKVELENEFYQGVSARYEHILAGADVVRSSKLEAIAAAFKEKRVVIIHAASGQGKTTLAYRYLHEYFPQDWRFRIQSVASRQHAESVALALTSNADAIGVPVAVYLDVSAQDRDWTELVRQISVHRNIRVLVTIREEDWRRANVSGAEFEFANIELELERGEAEEIYSSLTSKIAPVNVLNFEEAWSKFGESGPLMEFIHLVTQGSSLRERLAQQIKRLENEVREGRLTDDELEMLRLSAVASSYEARLQLKPLIKKLKLPAPKNTLNLFEKEYLLRVSDDGSLVGGLHPIRSAMLAELLEDPTFAPWSQSAGDALPFIQEQDLETFLLYSFSRHRGELDCLLKTLSSYQPKSWLSVLGCVRALIWLGLAEYIENNRALIWESAEKIGQGWSYFLDFDISDSASGEVASWWRGLGDIFTEEMINVTEELQSRQTDKRAVFNFAREWLQNRDEKPVVPTTNSGWQAAAETVFWAKRLKVGWALRDWFSDEELTRAIENLPLEIVADIVLAFSNGEFDSWLEASREHCINRFRKEMLVVGFEDDGRKITAHYIFDVDKLNDSSSGENDKNNSAVKNHFHSETMRRIKLLRKLLPNREEFAIQGYGHLLWENFLSHDDSIKKGIANKHLPLEWMTFINANFGGLGNLEFRPESWREYADAVLSLRDSTLASLKQLERALKMYFARRVGVFWNKGLDGATWERCKKLLNAPPRLPRSLVDEWGFSTEAISDELSEQGTADRLGVIRQNVLALQKYKPYLKCFDEHTRTLSNFFTQAVGTMLLQPLLGRSLNKAEIIKIAESSGIKENLPRLATLNLADTIKNLPQFQERARIILSPFTGDERLARLEKEEQRIFQKVWTMWYFLAFEPERVMPHADIWSGAQKAHIIKSIRSKLQENLRRICSNSLKLEIVSEELLWEEKSALWITANLDEPLADDFGLSDIIEAVTEAVEMMPDTELRHYVLDFNWSHLVVIPLIKGKYLNPTAWKINMATAINKNFGQGFDWVHFAQHAIPTDALEKLQLTAWNLPQLDISSKLLARVAELFHLAAHVRDFLRLPDRDEHGNILLQDYLTRFAKHITELLQQTLQSEEELIEQLKSIKPEILENNSAFTEILETLEEFHQNILPAAEEETDITMSIEEIADWASRLEKGYISASKIALWWTFLVLERNTMQALS